MSHAALLRAFALTACSLCLMVVVLGAYVRLSDAGLGCPDWPGCYGHMTPVGAAADLDAQSQSGRPLELGKAWREMLHRYAAGTLGVLIVCLAAMAVAWRRERIVSPSLAAALLGIVLLQGIFGMLTVTWRLKPLIVTLHLLFGLTTLSLLWWLVLGLARGHDGPWRHGAVLRGDRWRVAARRWRCWDCWRWRCRSRSAAGPAATTRRWPAPTCPPARAAGGRRRVWLGLRAHARPRRR
jgi:heme A synthase